VICDCDVTGTTSIIENIKKGRREVGGMKGDGIDREEKTTSQGEFP
jgi:hypothetical protein